MGFCAAERPEVVTAVPGTELEPPPPPPPTHPGEISAKSDLRILVSKQRGQEVAVAARLPGPK